MKEINKTIVALIVIVTFVRFCWVTCEFGETSLYMHASESIVLGHVDATLEKGFVWFTAIGGMVYFIQIFTLCGQKNEPEPITLLALCLAGTLAYEVPEAVMDYLLAKCRNFYITDMQLSTVIIQLVSIVFTLLLVTCVIIFFFCENGMRKSKDKLFPLGVCTLLLAASATGILAMRSLTLVNMTRLKTHNPGISTVSVLFLRNEDLNGQDVVTNYQLGRVLSRYGMQVNDVVLVNSLSSVVNSIRVSTRTEGSDDNAITVHQHYYFASMPCTNISTVLSHPDCVDNKTSIKFLFRYDDRRKSLSPYGQLHYSCGVRRNLSSGGYTCTNDCSSLQQGWGLHLLQVQRASGVLGGDESLVTSHWQKILACGPGKLHYTTRRLSACGAATISIPVVLFISSLFIACNINLNQAVVDFFNYKH